ncbi:MAG: polynucleotide adenylyltransferase PcnB [Sphaerochaetaceae bacterium]|nr:polynucleotide adenylyltransferase PcnB [Sphaerochaetaceae bacterium]
MKVRYKNLDGKLKAVSRVYTEEEHKLDFSKIDPDAIKVTERLQEKGYEAYIVGGAVRDILIGKQPKDFDIVTDASPRQVHKIFRNSRLIGHRFRIVHVIYGKKIFEVSTFRSTAEHDDYSDNNYGTMEEDASRRDFSINSLYYNPSDRTITDFNGALNDLRNKKIRSLIPLYRTFIEDPVRMIRAVKLAAVTGFSMNFSLRIAIKKYASTLESVSSSRLTEEVNKILSSGHSCDIIRELSRFGLLVYILPCLSVYIRFSQLFDSLQELDDEVNRLKENGEDIPLSLLYYKLVSPFITDTSPELSSQETFRDIFRQVKVLISPNTPPNQELENAVVIYMKEKGYKLKRQVRKAEPKPKEKQNAQSARKARNRSYYAKRSKKATPRSEQ